MKPYFLFALMTLAPQAFAIDYPIQGCWRYCSDRKTWCACTTKDAPAVQRERGMSYAAGVVQGYSMAMDCLDDPYGIESWGCPMPGEKRTKSRCTLAKGDLGFWAKPRPYSDGKESWFTVPGFDGTPQYSLAGNCPD